MGAQPNDHDTTWIVFATDGRRRLVLVTCGGAVDEAAGHDAEVWLGRYDAGAEPGGREAKSSIPTHVGRRAMRAMTVPGTSIISR